MGQTVFGQKSFDYLISCEAADGLAGAVKSLINRLLSVSSPQPFFVCSSWIFLDINASEV